MNKGDDKWLAEKVIFESLKVAEELNTGKLLDQLESMFGDMSIA
uniref:Uncharacterized protein n=1 Tax=uncultured bacterium A1Q1_fos_660 TaxID=1256588 RepID=L7VU53_9BACT|nr:hypothetical protein [uncultured bacterium A1Q1_fos_660]